MPLQNIVGYASNNTNIMIGEHNSVVSLQKQKIPLLFTMKRWCHSAHLCASHACEKLPRAIENLIRYMSTHFSHNAQHLAQYQQFQHFTNPH